ncbi:hypothetical protein MUN89_07360 [Halobacillus salinarum]|uniref:Uncharacterized protein n=1 Tax=Halobacillus salinarum TaxID=2932257 RepID=A0ABY4EPF2_9BACI|nr:hypothetical protein [Halobacillus salinarum]UOQ45738.1 hypothetical protein MUN89_07360 [Halobacillus salinarum]
MKTTYLCPDCRDLSRRLKQQEEVIAQLVDIIAVTNRRIYDLDQRQSGMEHQLIREHNPRYAPSTSS